MSLGSMNDGTRFICLSFFPVFSEKCCTKLDTMLEYPVTCDPLKLGVFAWITFLFAGIFPSTAALLRICVRSSPITSERHVVCTAMMSGSYRLKMFCMASRMFAWPPKTDAPSVNELVVAMIGSL